MALNKIYYFDKIKQNCQTELHSISENVKLNVRQTMVNVITYADIFIDCWINITNNKPITYQFSAKLHLTSF